MPQLGPCRGRADAVYSDDELLPISALQHMIFCDRQAALIHIERIWIDNSLTVEGDDLHRVVDGMHPESRRDLRLRRGIALRSERLGLTGKADMVEFHATRPDGPGVALPGEQGLWTIHPIEYKRGRPKAHRADEVQLCAQALCLEEWFDARVAEGSLFYGRTRRRHPVAFTSELRKLTNETAARLHGLVRSGRTPVRFREKKCQRCSLLPACLPQRKNAPRSARKYLAEAFLDVRNQHGGT